MSDTLKKILFWGLVALLLLPVVNKFRPRAVTFERAQAAFVAAGMTITEYQERARSSLESIAEVSMYVDTASVSIYQYDHEGKIATQLAYQKDDPGAAIVESWGLAQALGAAESKNIPQRSLRNGKFMLIARGYDEALLARIVSVFKGL